MRPTAAAGIAGAGSVTNSGNSGSDPGVIGCVKQEFSGLTIPKPESGIVTVIHPIMFSPGK